MCVTCEYICKYKYVYEYMKYIFLMYFLFSLLYTHTHTHHLIPEKPPGGIVITSCDVCPDKPPLWLTCGRRQQTSDEKLNHLLSLRRTVPTQTSQQNLRGTPRGSVWVWVWFMLKKQTQTNDRVMDQRHSNTRVLVNPDEDEEKRDALFWILRLF